jgi:hypothetical protein
VLASIAAAIARVVPAWCIEKMRFRRRVLLRLERYEFSGKARAVSVLLMFDLWNSQGRVEIYAGLSNRVVADFVPSWEN